MMVIGVPMILMSVIPTFVMVPIFGIFFFADLVGFIPGGFDEYFEGRVQVYDKDKEYDTDNKRKCHESNHDSLYRKKCDNSRKKKWNYEKK